MDQRKEESLFERLGGTQGISALVDDIVDAHMVNPAIQARFLPSKDDPEHFAAVKQHLCNFLAAGTGGPVEYKGKDMPAAHRGMNINEAEYLHTLDDILFALDKHNIDTQTRNEVLAIAYSLKDQIIGV